MERSANPKVAPSASHAPPSEQRRSSRIRSKSADVARHPSATRAEPRREESLNPSDSRLSRQSLARSSPRKCQSRGDHPQVEEALTESESLGHPGLVGSRCPSEVHREGGMSKKRTSTVEQGFMYHELKPLEGSDFVNFQQMNTTQEVLTTDPGNSADESKAGVRSAKSSSS